MGIPTRPAFLQQAWCELLMVGIVVRILVIGDPLSLPPKRQDLQPRTPLILPVVVL